MHLVIISGAARPQSKSNTAKVIAAFQKGFEESGNTRKYGISLTVINGKAQRTHLREMTVS